MRWTVGHGLSVDCAREVRLGLDGDELWLHEPSASPRRLGTTTTLTGAYLRTAADVRALRRWPADPLLEALGRRGRGPAAAVADQRDRLEGEGPSGALVVTDGSGPVLAVTLPDLMPPTAELGQALETTGVAALLEALGLTLQPAPPLDGALRGAEGRALLRPRRRRLAAARVVAWSCLVSAVLGAVALVLDVDWPSPFSVVAAVLLVIGTLGLVLGVARFRSVVRAGLDPAGRSVYEVPGTAPGTQLQLGRDDVVVVLPHEAEEIWLAGPDAGGVTSVQVGGVETQLRDASGRLLVSFATDELVPSAQDADRLRACSEAAGLRVDEGGPGSELGRGRTQPLRPLPGVGAGLWLRMEPRDAGQGGISVPITCGAAAAMGLIAPAGPGDEAGAIGGILVAVHAVCLVAVVWSEWSVRSWRRTTERKAGHG